jgi:hypothetical protein
VPSLVRFVRKSVAFAALGAGALHAAPAAACDACSCAISRGIQPVVDGGVTLPLNARFLIELNRFDEQGRRTAIEPSDVRWTDLDAQEEIAFALLPTTGSARQVWAVAKNELRPDTAYRIEAGPKEDPRTLQQTFTTGSSIDDVAPTAQLPVVTHVNSGACGAYDGALLEWTTIQDEATPLAFYPVVKLVIDGKDEKIVLFQTAQWHGNADRKALELAAPIDEGGRDCWQSAALPFANSDRPLTVSATIYDFAGNGFDLPPFEVNLQRQAGATCPEVQGSCAVHAPRVDGSESPFGLRCSSWSAFGLGVVVLVGLVLRRRK